MKNPFKRDEIVDDGGSGGCLPQAFSIIALMVGVLGAFAGAAPYGVSEFLARVG